VAVIFVTSVSVFCINSLISHRRLSFVVYMYPFRSFMSYAVCFGLCYITEDAVVIIIFNANWYYSVVQGH